MVIRPTYFDLQPMYLKKNKFTNIHEHSLKTMLTFCYSAHYAFSPFQIQCAGEHNCISEICNTDQILAACTVEPSHFLSSRTIPHLFHSINMDDMTYEVKCVCACVRVCGGRGGVDGGGGGPTKDTSC